MPEIAPDSSGHSGDSTAAHVDAQKYDQLVEEAIHGSDLAFTSLWRHFQPRMVRYLAMFTNEPEDLCSEVWIKIAASIGSFQGDTRAFTRVDLHNRTECSNGSSKIQDTARNVS